MPSDLQLGRSAQLKPECECSGIYSPATDVFSECNKTKRKVFILTSLQSATVFASAEKSHLRGQTRLCSVDLKSWAFCQERMVVLTCASLTDL